MRILVLLVTVIASMGLPAPLPAATITEIHYVMGTYLRIVAEGDEQAARSALRDCFALAREDDRRFSRFDPDSELSRINADAQSAVPVSAETAALASRALRLQQATAGRFDVTIGALTELWRTTAAWPPQSSIEAARPGLVQIVGQMLTRPPGVRLDFDGVAKGWTADRCAARLRGAGVDAALVSFGESSLVALGAPRGAAGWEVAVRGLDGDTAVGVLSLRNQAVSVSSIFGHGRQLETHRVGHIIDPRSGRPLADPAIAVVVAASATDAEAVSKAVLVQAARRQARGPAVGVPLEGVLLIDRAGLRRTGRIPFRPFRQPLPFTTEAEALR